MGLEWRKSKGDLEDALARVQQDATELISHAVDSIPQSHTNAEVYADTQTEPQYHERTSDTGQYTQGYAVRKEGDFWRITNQNQGKFQAL